MSHPSIFNKYFTSFVYVSLAFLLVFLYRSDFLLLDVKDINVTFLGASCLFLCGGFVVNAFCWFFYCRRLSAHISLTDAFVSHGLSVFGKYVPGKVWVILGRAAYLCSGGVPLKSAGQLSFYAQLVSIWCGLTLGLVGFAVVDSMKPMLGLLLPLWLLAALGVYFPVLVSGSRIGYLGRALDRVNALQDFITPRYVFSTLPVFIVLWLTWTVGFYLLGRAIVPSGTFEWQVMFAFPFAATVGILAIVFPGGLGIREGLIVYFMVQGGVPIAEATTVSIAARIWFIIGEVFIFVVAFVLRRYGTPTGIQTDCQPYAGPR